MLKFLPKCILSSLIATSALISTITTLPAVAADKPGIETFFNNEEIKKPSLSPDGKTLAMLAPAKQTGYLQIIVINLDNMSSKVLTGFSNADVASYSWVNNRRIVYSGGFHDVAEGDLRFYPGLFAINIDGTERVHSQVLTL